MYLIVHDLDAVRAIRIPDGDFVIGRSPDCSLVLGDSKVSRRHLLLRNDAQGLYFEDLNSRRGVIVNGQPMTSGLVVAGDTLRLHRTCLTISEHGLLAGGPQRNGVGDLLDDRAWLPYAEFFARLRACADTAERLRFLLEGLSSFIGAERGFVLLADGVGSNLIPVAALNVSNLDSLLAVSHTIVTNALASRQLVYVADSARDGQFPTATSLAEQHEGRTIVCAPLVAGGKAWGAMYLDCAASMGAIRGEAIPLVDTAAGLAAAVSTAAAARRRLLEADDKLRALRRLAKPVNHLVTGGGRAGRALEALVDAAASQDVTVMITGETGTGKEMVARAIHARSRRSDGPFVAVNCGALPPDIIEAELFGTEKGAYTGATEARPGRFEQASGGTLFLDEVGELPPSFQVKLLRVLQERTVARLGSVAQRKLDFRLLCATNADVEHAVRTGAMRQDFYYRVNVLRIDVKPLRERPEDIEPLARAFGRRLGWHFGVTSCEFTNEAMALLVSYGWPGNVRELHNVIERALVLGRGRVIEPRHLAIAGQRTVETAKVQPSFPRTHDEAKAQFERSFFERALAEARGNVAAVVRTTGIARATLYRKLRALGLVEGN